MNPPPFYLDSAEDIGNMDPSSGLRTDQTGFSSSLPDQVPTVRAGPSYRWVRHFNRWTAERINVEPCHGDQNGSSNSSTQLNVDCNQTGSNSSPQERLTLGPDQKRLKLNSLEGDALGTKSFQTGESSLVPMINASSELFGEVEPMGSDKALVSVENKEAAVARWLDNPQLQSPKPVVCEAESSNIALDESETEQQS